MLKQCSTGREEFDSFESCEGHELGHVSSVWICLCLRPPASCLLLPACVSPHLVLCTRTRLEGFQFGVPGFEDIGKRKKPRSVSDTRAELSGCSKFDRIEHCYFDDQVWWSFDPSPARRTDFSWPHTHEGIGTKSRARGYTKENSKKNRNWNYWNLKKPTIRWLAD